MAQQFEISDNTMIHDLRRTKTKIGDSERSGARLLRFGLLTLGVLCVVQAMLNLSLRLAFYSKDDTDQCPFNSFMIANMCQNEQSQQNLTQLCSCTLLRVLREYQALKKERDSLRNAIRLLKAFENYQGSKYHC